MRLDLYLAERGQQTRLASLIDAQPQLVWQWIKGARDVPADRCPDIERATDGVVSCEEMRPDVPWLRVTDAAWHWHPNGRPVIDVSARLPA